jgi:hypothetical protein
VRPLAPFLAVLLLLIATPARAAQHVWDGFNRSDSDKLGHAETGQRWRPMRLGPGEAWAIRGDQAAFLPGRLNDYVRYTRIASGSTSPTTMRIDADITFSAVSANVGVALNLAGTDHVFCKAERTPSTRQPYGFLAIGGRFDGAPEQSVLRAADYTFTKADQLTLGTTYHLALVRSDRSLTCSLTGTNSFGVPVSHTITDTLRRSQANGLTSAYAGLRLRYVVGGGASNEDDGGSRWDNVVVSDAV